MNSKSIATILRNNSYARLRHTPYFTDINIINNQKGFGVSDIENALKFEVKTNHKKGAAVLLDRVIRRPVNPEATIPLFDLVLPVMVCVNPLINQGEKGTGKDIEDIVDQVILTLNNTVVTPTNGALKLAGDDIDPQFDEKVGVLFTELDFGLQNGLVPQPKLPAPVLAVNGGLLAMSLHANFAGAQIWWTGDGSWPSPGNAAAHLYNEPFQPEGAAQRVCAVAFLAGYQPSDVAVTRR
jgi:hypothetical protein